MGTNPNLRSQYYDDLGEKIPIYEAMKNALETNEMKKLPGVTER